MDFTSEPQSDLLELLNSDTLDQLGALHSRYQEIKIAISGNILVLFVPFIVIFFKIIFTLKIQNLRTHH